MPHKLNVYIGNLRSVGSTETLIHLATARVGSSFSCKNNDLFPYGLHIKGQTPYHCNTH
jgi:hypothetical protein